MQPRKLYAAVAAALATCPLTHAAVEEMPSTLKDQQSVAITIYNENLALVKDTRRVTLEMGPNRLALREVSGRMRPGLRQAAQLRRLGAHAAADLAQRKAVRPHLQRHAARVFHQREVLVIDCDGHRLLVFQRARHLLHRGMGERARR